MPCLETASCYFSPGSLVVNFSGYVHKKSTASMQHRLHSLIFISFFVLFIPFVKIYCAVILITFLSYANIDRAFTLSYSDMSSKRKNIPIKLSPTLPIYSKDKGYFKPASKQTPHHDGFPYGKQEFDEENNNLKRHADSIADSIGSLSDSQVSPPVSKKRAMLSPSKHPTSSGGDKSEDQQHDVLDTVRKAVLGSDSSVSEKQRQISKMISELQSLQNKLNTSANDKRSQKVCLMRIVLKLAVCKS